MSKDGAGEMCWSQRANTCRRKAFFDQDQVEECRGVLADASGTNAGVRVLACRAGRNRSSGFALKSFGGNFIELPGFRPSVLEPVLRKLALVQLLQHLHLALGDC